MTGWRWDASLFEGAAAHYRAGRMPYPPALPDTLRDALGLDGTGRLLDVGCGPGSVTLLLAPHFERVVGVDADAAMVAEARVAADEAGVENADWLVARAEHLPASLGAFRTITVAQSFHWFDRHRVATLLRQRLDDGGALVHVQGTTHRGVAGAEDLPAPEPPHAEITALVRRYLGEARRAGASTLPAGSTPGDEARVLRGCGFEGPRRVPVPDRGPVERTEDQVVAAVLSLSWAAPHLFGDRVDEFVADLRALLRSVAPDGRFAEQPAPVALDVWVPVQR